MLSDNAILDNLPGGVIVTDEHERIAYVNRFVQHWFGYEAEEMIGRATSEFMDGEGKIMLQTQLHNGSDSGLDSYIVPFKTKGGEKVWTKINVKQIQANAGDAPGKIVCLQDYTHAQKQQIRFEKLVAKLGKSETEFKEMLYAISHDVRAPVRGINSLVEWICTDYKDVLDEEGVNQLNLIKSRVTRLDGLLEGVLLYSRVVNRIEQKAEANLEEMVKDICETLENPQAVPIDLKLENQTLVCEPIRTRAIFEELIKNAVQNMDKENGTVEVGADWSSYYVKDDGPGISQKDQKEVFKLFKTLPRKDKRETAGIGLTLAKKCVDLQEGRIWIESDGRGTMVRFKIPNMKTT